MTTAYGGNPGPVRSSRRHGTLLDMHQETPGSGTEAPQQQTTGWASHHTIADLQAVHLVHWLRAALTDARAYPFISLFYGACFWMMALLLGWLFQSSPEYVMSLASGCLLVGPFLAMGLYDVSRRRMRGQVARLRDSLLCWRFQLRSMGLLALVFLVLELLWGRASLVVFAVFFNTGLPSTTGVVQAVFNPDNWEFIVAYVLVGGVFAAVVFATAVVSIPMILDHDADAITAAIASMEVVVRNPGVMAAWGLLISGTIALALALPWGSGLLVLGPLLGHASWHAYCSAVQWPDDAAAIVV